MHSFEGFTLSGANINRYLPIYGNAAGIIGAYRKYAEPHRKNHASPLEIGQVPLFLLDGELPSSTQERAVKKLGLTAFVILYRPFDIKMKKRYEDTFSRVRGFEYMRKDGEMADWVKEDLTRFETTDHDFVRETLARCLQPVFDFEKAREEYLAAITALPVDAATGLEVADDLNDYLYRRARIMFPLGVESILESNKKQSMIPKRQCLMDGFENAPPPKGVRYRGRNSLTDTDPVCVEDSANALHDYLSRRIREAGAVTLAEIVTYCAGIGLYRSGITLYVIGAALRFFNLENAVFYDSVGYWRFTEEPDISTWLLRVYDNLQPRLIMGEIKTRDRQESASALFFDDTKLQARLEYVFGIGPARDGLHTLGMTIVLICNWISHHLRYPIALLDETLYSLLRERNLYGETLRRYDAYFTAERCDCLAACLPRADDLARRLIAEAVGFDPDTTRHGMSNLPKGHYAPVLFTAEEYVEAMVRRWPACQ